jgi:peroxiredoxin
MAKTPSSMLPLGTKAAEFTLIDTCSGKELSLTELKSNIATVILFICNHCPFVLHIQSALVDVATRYQKKNIQFIAISSNDAVAYPADGPEQMREVATKHHYPFPYLYDETQDVARAYHAACTPDLYVFDKDLLCVYRGRFDDSTPGNGNISTGIDLTNALDQLLAHQPIDQHQQSSIGCNIKWKS